MASDVMEVSSVGEAFIRLLGERGVKYFFANAGTDFPPIIEGFSKAAGAGFRVPQPVTVPHENVAIAMAAGFWLMTGEMQAVMTHVNVGTANALCGLLNACRGNIPLLFCSGRTPYTEVGHLGSRNLHIHWMQEMFDQAGMLREAVKWEYELRYASQLETVVDRALGIADSSPKGPTYISLPREVIAEPIKTFAYSTPSRHGRASVPFGDPRMLEQVGDMLATAQRPLIITSAMGLDDKTSSLASFSAQWGVPVVQHVPRCVSLKTSHPMHAGYDPAPWLKTADLVLVLESTVPWIREACVPRTDAKVVHVGVDPLHVRVPIRGFETDLAITASASGFLSELDKTLSIKGRVSQEAIAERKDEMVAFKAAATTRRKQTLEAEAQQVPISSAWFSHCLNAIIDPDATIMREAPQLLLPYLALENEYALFNAGAAGGLGWGLGAALGAKLGAPDRTLIAVEGDGSYMFNVPIAAHYVAMEMDLPFLTIIMNNRRWNEVRAATKHIYPTGSAITSNRRAPLTHFDERLDLSKAVQAVGGHGEQVTHPSDLPEALRRALRMVKDERRQVVLDVICA